MKVVNFEIDKKYKIFCNGISQDKYLTVTNIREDVVECTISGDCYNFMFDYETVDRTKIATIEYYDNYKNYCIIYANNLI